MWDSDPIITQWENYYKSKAKLKEHLKLWEVSKNRQTQEESFISNSWKW